jgi:hypothetical protein
VAYILNFFEDSQELINLKKNEEKKDSGENG